MRFTDLTGQRFGRLTINRRLDNDASGRARWRCLCDCGGETAACTGQLRSGMTKSCGCIHREGLIARSTKHGGRHTREYALWSSMLRRCRSPNDRRYSDYGGRGIAVCARWQTFENFVADMGQRPSPKHSIDRIDNDKGYEPNNCRWATRTEQARNTRTNKLLTIGSTTKPLAAWCEQYGASYTRTIMRVRAGWSLERALTEPSARSR